MSILEQSMQNSGAAPGPAVAEASGVLAQPAPQGAAPAPAGAGALPAPNPEIVCPAVKAHMDDVENMRKLMSPEQLSAFDRVVAAGKKVLYSKESAEMVQGLMMDDEIPIRNKLGEGVANLLVMMDNQANGSIPKETMIPAGVAILFEAADYMFECGFDVSEKDLADAMETMVYGVFQGYQIPPEKVDEVIDDIGKKMGFEEGDADKVMEKVEGAQEKGVIREPIPAGGEEEAAFQQGFNEQRGV